MSEETIIAAVTELTKGFTKVVDDMRRLQTRAFVLQTVLAASVNPQNPLEAFQEIEAQQKYAQTLQPDEQLPIIQKMIESIQNSKLGHA